MWQQDVLAALEARMPTLKALFAAPPAAAAAAAAEQKDESGKKDKSPLQKFKAEFQAVLKEMESIKSTPVWFFFQKKEEEKRRKERKYAVCKGRRWIGDTRALLFLFIYFPSFVFFRRSCSRP